VQVSAPARLHFGFIDLHGGLGRCFGSLGMAIERPLVRLRAMRAESVQAAEVTGTGAERVERALAALRDAFGVGQPIQVHIEETIPAHAGLGSGTQLALAAARAACMLSGVEVPVPQLARCLERGARSGIGSGVFELGGFVVDGGRGTLDRAPPVISRLPFPEDWRVLLLFDPALTGLHGERETAAFRDLPRFPERRAEQLARSVLMRLLPALAEHDIREFGAALTELQQAIGDHFAPAQGGRFASARVESALRRLAARGVVAHGQSSWGPTGFAIVDSPQAADEALESLRDRPEAQGLSIQVVNGCNRGARCVETRAWKTATSSIS
jgi:beta-ribofuranosylaminobenzene 5'-phosphate synthase